jgi:glycosyltransferase involved in cell wall biosynthesis
VVLAAPGLYARPGFGPSEHVLSLATALAATERFRVDVVFAAELLTLNGRTRFPFGLHVLDEHTPLGDTDSVALGLSPLRYLRHVNSCRLFSHTIVSCDVLIERMWGFGGWLARVLHPRVLLLEENGPLTRADAKERSFAMLRNLYVGLAHQLLRRTYASADAIVVQSRTLAELLAREFGAHPERVEVIPNGSANAPATPASRQELGWPRSSTVIVYAGMLDEAHDLEPVLRAFAQVNRDDLQLVIYGGGPDEERLRALGTPRTSFCAPVSRQELAPLLRAADIGIAPYGARAFDGNRFLFSSLKVEEYRAARLHTIVTTGALSSSLASASLVQIPNTEAAWLQALNGLPEHAELPKPPMLAHGLSWDDVAARYVDLIDRVLRPVSMT